MGDVTELIEYPTINLHKLKPHQDNPRVHSEEQIRQIADSIRELDWGRPVIISSDYYILAGHGAVEGAELLGDDNPLGKDIVPYKMMKWKHSDPEAKAYMVADNRLTDLSEWNYADLELVYDDLKIEGYDTKLTGFEEHPKTYKVETKVDLP